jgi:outer membrane protein insertion porin family
MSKRVVCVVVAIAAALAGFPIFSRAVRLHSTALASQTQNVTVELVQVRGSRRIPESTIKIWIGTREGDPYNPVQLDRDVRALYAQGHFADVKVFAEEGTRGGKVVTFEVTERPLLLDIKYEGLKSIQQSTILEEFRKRSVGLSKESQYDPVKARRAAAVIKELLGNEGRPEAKVEPQIEEISRTAVGLTFMIDEGPRFRVADIEFEGNTVFSNSHLRSRMKFVKQLGWLTTFSSKDIYHKEKLEADLDRLRVLTYADNGYLKAQFGEPRVEQVGKVGTWVPIFGHKGQGLKIIIPVSEGRQYQAGTINVEDNTEFTADEIKSVIGLKSGDLVKGYSVVQKGLENLKKLYGTRGYIQFNSGFVPTFHDDPNDSTKGTVDITFSMEEGKQYTLHRFETIGNHFTRDSVIRREVLLNEGERYNEQMWDLSILRLNQLGYFDQIQKEDATINTNEKEGQVDLTLKVQEKGRQQISFTGGISGLGGNYIGLDYSTNNLLGYGESLSVSIAAGNLQRILSFGFTEPYFRGRPISVGFTIFYQNYQFLGQGFSATNNQNSFQSFSGESLFTQKTAGASVSASAPLSYFTKNRFRMGRFTRLGLSYSFRTTNILDPAVNRDDDPQNDILVTYRQSGVTQSTVTPTIAYNTLNNSLDPTKGTSMTVGLSFSGGPLGGKVNTVQPTFEFKHFRPFFAGKESAARAEAGKSRTLGVRFLTGHILSFGTPFESNSLAFVGGTPLFARYFLGGEQDIRGYNIRGISPAAPVVSTFSTRNVFAETLDGKRMQVRPASRATDNSITPQVLSAFTFTDQVNPAFPVFPTFVGGDTMLLLNVEYRIPIVGPVSFAPFFDIGSPFNLKELDDQFERSEFIPNQILNTRPVTLNPKGQIATPREIRQATPPESLGGLPPGFKNVFIRGDIQNTRQIRLSDTVDSLLDNYRVSMGGEIRVQVPVINVPFRLIFAYNPNAKVNDLSNPFFFEQKKAIRFSIGRTF